VVHFKFSKCHARLQVTPTSLHSGIILKVNDYRLKCALACSSLRWMKTCYESVISSFLAFSIHPSAPHSRQNFRPSGISVRHFVQFIFFPQSTPSVCKNSLNWFCVEKTFSKVQVGQAVCCFLDEFSRSTPLLSRFASTL